MDEEDPELDAVLHTPDALKYFIKKVRVELNVKDDVPMDYETSQRVFHLAQEKLTAALKLDAEKVEKEERQKWYREFEKRRIDEDYNPVADLEPEKQEQELAAIVQLTEHRRDKLAKILGEEALPEIVKTEAETQRGWLFLSHRHRVMKQEAKEKLEREVEQEVANRERLQQARKEEEARIRQRQKVDEIRYAIFLTEHYWPAPEDVDINQDPKKILQEGLERCRKIKASPKLMAACRQKKYDEEREQIRRQIDELRKREEELLELREQIRVEQEQLSDHEEGLCDYEEHLYQREVALREREEEAGIFNYGKKEALQSGQVTPTQATEAGSQPDDATDESEESSALKQAHHSGEIGTGEYNYLTNAEYPQNTEVETSCDENQGAGVDDTDDSHYEEEDIQQGQQPDSEAQEGDYADESPEMNPEQYGDESVQGGSGIVHEQDEEEDIQRSEEDEYEGHPGPYHAGDDESNGPEHYDNQHLGDDESQVNADDFVLQVHGLTQEEAQQAHAFFMEQGRLRRLRDQEVASYTTPRERANVANYYNDEIERRAENFVAWRDAILRQRLGPWGHLPNQILDRLAMQRPGSDRSPNHIDI
ncbi:hypothetical protein TWF696_001064 [Orbilia brochopaga]|uniref:Coiled-coil domain-containing protein n=1 Tax=Orbilia brochopaga TaxID=3140254 RepID=A0AAV9VEE4_9PEZI